MEAAATARGLRAPEAVAATALGSWVRVADDLAAAEKDAGVTAALWAAAERVAAAAMAPVHSVPSASST